MKYPDIGFEIKVVSNLLKRNVFNCDSMPKADEATEMEGKILGFLIENRHKDNFQKDVEENFCIRRSTTSRFLRGMEQKGLIQRQTVSSDARLKKIIVTEKALSIHEAIQEQIRTVEKKITQGLTEEELLQFHKTIEKIINNLV